MLKDMLKFEQVIHNWNLKGLKEGETGFMMVSIYLTHICLNILGISAVLQYINFDNNLRGGSEVQTS